jgi:hypothetical protein
LFNFIISALGYGNTFNLCPNPLAVAIFLLRGNPARKKLTFKSLATQGLQENCSTVLSEN